VRRQIGRNVHAPLEKLIGARADRLADCTAGGHWRLLHSLGPERTYAPVSQKQHVASPRSGAAWTKAEDYIGALTRKHSFRRATREKVRTQPERPRLLLSTLPFLAVIGLLAVLAVAIMITAFPGTQPQPKLRQIAAHEQGVAERGWFQKAQKEFR
jgi:hypothetical protein